MQLLKFVPIKLTLFLIAGILFGHYFILPLPITISIVAIGFTFLLFLFKLKQTANSIYFGITALLLMFFIGVTAITIANPKNLDLHYINNNNNQPREVHIKIIDILKPTLYSKKYIGEVLSIDRKESRGNILLNIIKDTTTIDLKVDDEFITFKKFSPLTPSLNPHQFNYKEYLEGLAIYNQINSNAGELIKLSDSNSTIYGIASNLRSKIIESLKKQNFGKEELTVIQALLLGQRNDLSETTYTDYKNAGAVHILALSGLHIGILLYILQFLLQPIERIKSGKKIKLALIVLLLWGFALLAGLSASIVRAVTMFSFLAYAKYLNRPTNTFNILALSLFFILLINPTYLFQVGFQMSYAAVFAIVWIYPMLQNLWFPKNLIARKIWQLLSISAAAQLGVLPISLFYFHQFPSLFFISNLIIIPFLGLILGYGIVVIILSIWNIPINIITDTYNDIIHLMNAIVKWIAKQENFIIKEISFDAVQLFLVYIAVVLLISTFQKVKFKKTVALLFSILLLQTWSIYNCFRASNKESLYVLHRSKNTALIYQKGTDVHLLSNTPTSFIKITKTYATEERAEMIIIDSLKNSYTYGSSNLYIIDSTTVYPFIKQMNIILTQSPKINLEILIDSIQPRLIITDGSNYKSDVLRWKETCKKRKLPFHYTGEKGAYYFNLKK
ncbi:ComEC/Rec2 family competence protein [Cellulophaga sp. HaHaR_3_176]|uniref:ComEC/Rec2 family competence protein n=1 Tax=Cellulophaga sp. HaHaR_3_176 TaxID=1942464 RepID=UPI001C1F3879|nr:ComEC/Rec2 family competence protein [Cellulophaga sp. HaHaR_3_176]QWX83149.1 ComEC/Rec2 family competence protein [Cellulophaga sp. HaHaR_3_176]